MKKALLLLNLGTPEAPTTQGLRKFYRHFFADPFVFDMPAWGRWLLRNLVIQPFRAPRTARQYAAIWMEGGSPLKVYSDRLQENLQAALESEGITVSMGMAYSRPFIADEMAALEKQAIAELTVIPLFPQFSSATTASAFHAVREAAGKWEKPPHLNFVSDLFSEAAFIRAWSVLITRYLGMAGSSDAPEHVVFSYHGLPERNLLKADSHGHCRFAECCSSIGEANRYCYRAQCMATTRGIVEALGWSPGFYSVAFQSRFGRQEWIKPYLDTHIEALARQGIRRLAVVTPSFVSDCLETLHEIGIEYREQFLAAGGEELILVPNLNQDPAWFAAMREIARKHLQGKS